MPHRYFAEILDNKTAILKGKDAQHLNRVMRGKIGDKLILCNGEGVDYEAELIEICPEESVFKIIKSWPSQTEANLFVHLYLGMTKADKFEWAVQKSVEMGCKAITPFYSEYTVVKPKKDSDKVERYNRISKEAAKQSGRGIIPNVFMPLNYIEMVKEAVKSDYAVFCYEHGGISFKNIFEKAETKNKRVSVIIGPEGGFSKEEADAAQNAGCIKAGLGARILRSETAPIAALSAIMVLTGNM